jgi:hypothetical protein
MQDDTRPLRKRHGLGHGLKLSMGIIGRGRIHKWRLDATCATSKCLLLQYMARSYELIILNSKVRSSSSTLLSQRATASTRAPYSVQYLFRYIEIAGLLPDFRQIGCENVENKSFCSLASPLPRSNSEKDRMAGCVYVRCFQGTPGALSLASNAVPSR